MKLIFILILISFSHLAPAQKAKTSFAKNTGTDSENYQSATFNGSWCWFSDPRAVYYEGKHQRTYMGWIDNWGDIVVGFYDHKTTKIETQVIAKDIEVDDHNTPSLFFDEKGHLMVSYNLHMMADMPLYLVRAKNAEDISEWEDTQVLRLNDAKLYPELGNKANGQKITDLTQLPMLPAQNDRVYNATPSGAKAWNWDIAEDENGYPVIAYAKFPNDTTHIYCYARWDGKKWLNYELINSGKWFPKTQTGKAEREPNYSGGMSIDKEDPNTLYLSVNRDSVFEIEKWVTSNGGKSWKDRKSVV